MKLFGYENLVELQKPSLGAEDFAEFLNYVPGAMFRLGVSGKFGCSPLHSAKFNPDEKAIRTGIELLTDIIDELNN